MSVLRSAATRLRAAGVASPEADAALLLAHARGVSLSQAHSDDLLGRAPDPASAVRFEELMAARENRTPVQHLTGTAGFRHLELAVGPGVFVPRPETEMMVDLALAHLPEGGRVVDLCTGSGAIALALATERPDARVHAVELDPMAHAWAARNVASLAPEVDLRCGDARTEFAELLGQVDVVVCNPPYIPTGMVPLDPEVRDHDPELALYGGSEDGLAIPLAVAAHAQRLLVPGGFMVMEHADSQGDSLPRRLRDAGWEQVADVADLNERPRATVARSPLR